MDKLKDWLKSPLALPLGLIALLVIYFFGICDVYSVLDNRKSEVFPWMVDRGMGETTCCMVSLSHSSL